MKRDIVKYGNKILRQECEIAIQDEQTKRIIQDLKDTLFTIENGAGLASPQININSRIFITRNYRDDKVEEFLVFINPKIKEKSKECVIIPDGCLSIPNVQSKTKRHSFIQVSYLDENFNEINEELEGFQSVVFQHELDHLNGKLFIDLLDEEEKETIDSFFKRQETEKNIFYVEGKIISMNLSEIS